MPFKFDPQEFQRKANVLLSTRYGGNLIQKPSRIEQKQISVFIGLGGLGCRAVNAVKAISSEKLDNPERRLFLCMDTSKADFDLISLATEEDVEAGGKDDTKLHGCITNEEKCILFPGQPIFIKDIGHGADTWLDKAQFGEKKLDKTGAGAVRQMGRAALFLHYSAVYNKIEAVMKEAFRLNKSIPHGDVVSGEIKVYIVAGISGGTGSGTVVDVSYMVRKAIAGLGRVHFNVEGVLFTPDVQENDEGIRGEDKKHQGIREDHKRNFYAAIKEIDYFYNNIARKKRYESLIGDENEAYGWDIFENCTIISRHAAGSVIADDSNGVIKKLANALTYEISSAEGQPDEKTPPQKLSSFMDNIHTHVNGWLLAGGNDLMRIPEWAPPRYSTLGYSSFYVPRDELLAYCANMLIEALAKDWKEKILPRDKMDQFMSRYGLRSLRQFAKKLFELAECGPFFDVPHKEQPKDPVGAKVKNCCSYLETMKQIALDEGQEVNADEHVRIAAEKLDRSIVDPICSHVEKAFFDPDLGPAYATHLIYLVSATNPGLIQRLSRMLAELEQEAQTWEDELATMYNALYKKGEEFEMEGSVDAGELESFTSDCREYGEKLLQCRLLRRAYQALFDVYDKINKRNDTVFQVYTVTFKYLCEMLAADSAYVTNPTRHKEGSTTTFSFSIANFDEGDPISAKFKALFKGLIAEKDMQQEAKDFIAKIFGGIKKFLQPDPGDTTEYTEDDVIKVINGYFQETFPLWTKDVIERFCVIAYSRLDITPKMLNTIWNDPAKQAARDTAFASTAGTVITELDAPSRPMLSMIEAGIVIDQFPGYDVMMALPDTPDINAKITDQGHFCSPLVNGWSEFIRFRRVVGIPLCFINDLDDCQRLYNGALTPGFHLDEVGDNWRENFPEPYGYNMRKRMEKYVDDRRDQVEFDRNRMKEILALAREALALGILEHSDESFSLRLNEAAENTINQQIVYYKLSFAFVRNVDLTTASARDAMYNAIEAVVLENDANGIPNQLLSVLQNADYPLQTPVEIRWTFPHPIYNARMPDCTGFGDDIVFGNFVTLIRSNYDWYVKLKNAVALFSVVRPIYEKALATLEAKRRYNARLKNVNAFVDAIRVGRITPHESELTRDFDGYKFVVGERTDAKGEVTETCEYYFTDGLRAFDKIFSLYHAFITKYYELDPAVFDEMCAFVEHDLSASCHKEYRRAPRENVNWFINHIRELLKNPQYFNNAMQSVIVENFRNGLADSQYAYSLPESSRNRTDIEAIRRNLKSFYDYVLQQLEQNKIPDDRPYPDDPAGAAAAPAQPTKPTAEPTPAPISAGWDCPACGTKGNDGNFCKHCGGPKPQPQPQPQPQILWDCPVCGTKENDGNFCKHCGAKKPEPSTRWDCPACGKKDIDGKFCPNCGMKKPEPSMLWDCPVCGKTGIDGKFCPNCGKERVN